jgi:hypothetical protein
MMGTGTVYRPQEAQTPHPDERVAKAVAVAVGKERGAHNVSKRCQVYSLTRAGASRGACLLKRPSLHMTTSKTSGLVSKWRLMRPSKSGRL